MSAGMLPPLPEDLAARLRAAAAAASPSEARTWLPKPPSTAGILRALIQVLCTPGAGWCREA
jgi:hypothetical protein